MQAKIGWVRVGIALATLCWAVGCGGDDDSTGSGSGAAPQFDLPSGKQLSQLTPEEANKACQTYAEAASQVLNGSDAQRLTCTLTGALASLEFDANGNPTVNQSKCNDAVQQCLSGGSGSGGAAAGGAAGSGASGSPPIDCNTANTPAQFMNCTATVGEMQACLDATFKAYQDAVNSVTCANVSSMLTAGGNTMPTTQSVAECQTVQSKCPNLPLP